MQNSFIGNPLALMNTYLNRSEYRELESMTDEEATLILNFAVDNGDFKGMAVNSIQVSSRARNFIEGDVSFGGKDTYHFEIRYDATVQIYKLEYDEEEVSFVPTGGLLKTYRTADITFLMMNRGFNMHQHLL